MTRRWILLIVGLVLVVGCTALAIYRSRNVPSSTIDFSFLSPYIKEDTTEYYKEYTTGSHIVPRYVQRRFIIVEGTHSGEISKMVNSHFNASNGWSGGMDRVGIHGIGFYAESTTQPGDHIGVGGFEGGGAMVSYSHVLSPVEVSMVRMQHPGEDVFKSY